MAAKANKVCMNPHIVLQQIVEIHEPEHDPSSDLNAEQELEPKPGHRTKPMDHPGKSGNINKLNEYFNKLEESSHPIY